MLVTKPPFHYSYEFSILLFLIHMYEETCFFKLLKKLHTFCISHLQLVALK